MTEHLLQFPPIMKRLVNIKLAPLFTADIYTLELSHTLTDNKLSRILLL